jgi:hypothetical protein
MLATLMLGSVYLLLCAFFVCGIVVWGLSKILGFPVNFTPQNLWSISFRFGEANSDTLLEENRKLLANLEERRFEEYRRQVRADILYGFKHGNPDVWRDSDFPTEIRSTDDIDRNAAAAIECAICMETF